MRKRVFSFLAALVLTGSVLNSAAAKSTAVNAAQEEPIVVNGLIADIARDGSYIVVDADGNSTKFFTSAELVEEAYFELGDKVNITGEKGSRGLMLVDYEYDFDYDYDVTGDNYEEEEGVSGGDIPVLEPADGSDVSGQQ